MFKVELKTENAAFMNPSTGERDEFWEANELIRILDKIREQLEEGQSHGTIMDINGNKAGYWES